MKCLLVCLVLIISSECAVMEDMVPQSEFYSPGDSASAKMACVEIYQGPNTGTTKVCGPVVSTAPTSTRSNSEHMALLPQGMFMKPPIPLLASRQAVEYSGCSTPGRYMNIRQYPGVNYSPNYVGSFPYMPTISGGGPRMSSSMMEQKKTPLFSVDTPMEKSRSCAHDNFGTALTSSWPAMQQNPSYAAMQPLRMNQNDPMLTMNSAATVMSMQKSGGIPANQMKSGNNAMGTTIEQLKLECDEKDKMIEENRQKIEELQKEITSKNNHAQEMAKAENNTMPEQKTARKNINTIERKV